MRGEKVDEGNTGIVAFADHLHALTPIEHTTGEGTPKKHKRASLKPLDKVVEYILQSTIAHLK